MQHIDTNFTHFIYGQLAVCSIDYWVMGCNVVNKSIKCSITAII